MRLYTASGGLDPVTPALPDLRSVPRQELRAAMERVADRLVASGTPPREALRMAYESLLRVASRQGVTR